MTITGISVPSITDEDRSKRLIDANVFWNERIAEDAASAFLTYKVSGEATGSVASRIQAGRHVFHIDEPAGLAGDDLAASAVEFALGAFIACQIVVYRLYAQHLGIRIDALSADVEGELDGRTPRLCRQPLPGSGPFRQSNVDQVESDRESLDG